VLKGSEFKVKSTHFIFIVWSL